MIYEAAQALITDLQGNAELRRSLEFLRIALV